MLTHTCSQSTQFRGMPKLQDSSNMDLMDISEIGCDTYLSSGARMNDSEEEYITEDDQMLPDPAPSGRSSISSFPASVIHHNITPSQTFPHDIIHTPSRSRTGTPLAHQRDHRSPSPLPYREHVTGFRNPSSVRALQMRDEYSDGEDITPGHRRQSSRMSYISYRSGSAHSTPGKRLSRSLQSSPVKNNSRLRKEFPLVLLHCTIMPSTISTKAKLVSEELLEAIVPEPYKRRWKLLQDKTVKNSEVCERGVLIPHPKEDYDALEEKLLESLELEQPMLSHGHFVGRSESRASGTDSGLGSEDNSNRGNAMEEEEVEEDKCADCGSQICGDRRWEVKVFAANGLMRSGAWNAAWSEMEKVDVQVSVWLPEAVRQEIEARLDAVIVQEQQLQMEEMVGKEMPGDDDRTKEIYGENTKPRMAGERNASMPRSQQSIPHRNEVQAHFEPSTRLSSRHTTNPPPKRTDLQAILLNYVWLLLQDRRNIAIVLLTALLIFYGMNGNGVSANKTVVSHPPAHGANTTKFEYLTSTITSTSTSIALETSTITETAVSSSTTTTLLDTKESTVVEATKLNFAGDAKHSDIHDQLSAETKRSTPAEGYSSLTVEADGRHSQLDWKDLVTGSLHEVFGEQDTIVGTKDEL